LEQSRLHDSYPCAGIFRLLKWDRKWGRGSAPPKLPNKNKEIRWGMAETEGFEPSIPF
jgi:hypothetical protein